MTKDEAEQTALFRFSVIAPAVNGLHPYKTKTEFFRNAAKDPLLNPATGKKTKYSWKTLACWCCQYRKEGFDGLKPSTRSDFGQFRRLDDAAKERIVEILEKNPRMPNTRIRKRLKDEGIITNAVSQSTVDRFVRSVSHEKKLPEIHSGKDRKAFEFEYANECWQADTTFLYEIDGKRVCLMIILDDASRMVVGHGFFYNDSSINFLRVLKKAVSVYGKPRKLYTDNGAPYANKQLSLICAKAGIHCAHAPVRDGAAKGKVERFNRTLKDGWLRETDWESFESLEDAEKSFSAFLYPQYINKPHSSLPENEEGRHLTPRERFLRDSELLIHLPEEELDWIFVCRYERKVKTDSTVSLHNICYEVPSEYIKEKVEIYLDPCGIQPVCMEDPETGERIEIKEADRIENAHSGRKKRITYGSDDEEEK